MNKSIKFALGLFSLGFACNSFSAGEGVPTLGAQGLQKLEEYRKAAFSNGSTPLIEALKDNNNYDNSEPQRTVAGKIAEYLLVAQPELINKVGQDGKLPIELANQADIGLIKKLMRNILMRNIQSSQEISAQTLSNLFKTAIVHNDIPFMDVILKQGVDINNTLSTLGESQGETPITSAVVVGSLDALKWLIDHKADANKNSADGKTPIATAKEQIKYTFGNQDIINRYQQMIDLLKQAGAKESAEDEKEEAAQQIQEK